MVDWHLSNFTKHFMISWQVEDLYDAVEEEE